MNGETMVGFGPKQAWLAVRDTEPAAVVEALRLRDLGPVPWRSGIALAYLTDDRLVLTPPLPGAGDSRWVLVAGRWLLGAGSEVDIAELSTVLHAEVQYFATYRVTERHRWERAADGDLIRAFAYAGETGDVTRWRGEPDTVEAALGLPPVPDDDHDILVSEEDVLRVADAWSVDPSTLSARPAPGPLRAAAVP